MKERWSQGKPTMVIKKIDWKWYRVKGRTIFPRLYCEDETLATGRPIFDSPEWVNNFGSHSRHGYEIFQGRDGNFYTVDASGVAHPPMFERIFDLSLTPQK